MYERYLNNKQYLTVSASKDNTKIHKALVLALMALFAGLMLLQMPTVKNRMFNDSPPANRFF